MAYLTDLSHKMCQHRPTKKAKAMCLAYRLNLLLEKRDAGFRSALARQSRAIEVQGDYAVANPSVAPKNFPVEIREEFAAAVKAGTGATVRWTCACGSVNPKLTTFLLTDCCKKGISLSAW